MGSDNKIVAFQKSDVAPDPVASEYFRRETFEPNAEAERAILGLVFRRGPITQLEIAREVDRSQQTVSRLIARLIERGSLQQGKRISSGKRGQLSTSIEVAPDYAYSFGVAILWDALAVTVMDFSGAVIDHRLKVMTLMTHDDVVDELRSMINELSDQWIPDDTRGPHQSSSSPMP